METKGHIVPHLTIVCLAIGTFLITLLITYEDKKNSWMLDNGYINYPLT